MATVFFIIIFTEKYQLSNSNAALMHRADRRKQMPSQALYRASCFMFEERLQDGFRVFLPNQSRSQCLT